MKEWEKTGVGEKGGNEGEKDESGRGDRPTNGGEEHNTKTCAALTVAMLLERTSIESQQSHLVELCIKANSYSNSCLPA